MTVSASYPRDLKGYGGRPPHPNWPDQARIALQFVLNVEEGGENCILHGDTASEAFLSEIIGADARAGVRHMNMESMYEYGSRAGGWRVLDLFNQNNIPITLFTVGMAAERNPDFVRYAHRCGHEICSHGYRWIDYQYVDEQTERNHIELAVEAIQKATGEPPQGWYTGRTSPQTRALVAADGRFVYDADDYSDDLPWWDTRYGQPQLVVPYTLDANDMRFATAQGFNSGRQFYEYLKDSFDVLYEEGRTLPKMMSVGLHCRLAGRPGRFAALKKFVEYVQRHDRVWCCRRIDIARHWIAHHPFSVHSDNVS